MSNAVKGRTSLATKKMIVALGAIDCITGCAIAQAGALRSVHDQRGTSATLGYPDYDMSTLSEMVGNDGRR